MAETELNSPPVRHRDELEAYFHEGSKDPSQWKIGVEYEKPVVDRRDGSSVAYEGDRGIGALLGRMLEASDSWRGVYDGPNLIALEDGNASITLEPGGQLEMSGRLCDSLHCAQEELDEHVDEILNAAEELDLGFLGLGAAPKTPLAKMPWMPKSRYRVMRRVMERTGTLGHRMMQQTATVQCNFDYRDERDATLKMRAALALAPVLIGLSANSPIIDGRPSGYRSFRSHVWTDTDADRCGVLPFVFNEKGLFAAYTEWALDVPMYFVARRGALLEPPTPMSFRTFMTKGFQGEEATMADWDLHLTTVFPEVRLKRYIEVRSADSQSVDLMLGTPALMKGIFYDDDCLGAALDEVAKWGADEVLRYNEAASRLALKARVGNFSLQELAVALIEISREGLKRQQALNASGEDETKFLDVLEEQARAGRCPADEQIKNWEGRWHGNVDRLVDFALYRRA